MDITEARALKIDTTLHYTGKRPTCDVPSWMKELVSFRRMIDDRLAEVFTADGSRLVDIANLANTKGE